MDYPHSSLPPYIANISWKYNFCLCLLRPSHWPRFMMKRKARFMPAFDLFLSWSTRINRVHLHFLRGPHFPGYKQCCLWTRIIGFTLDSNGNVEGNICCIRMRFWTWSPTINTLQFEISSVTAVFFQFFYSNINLALVSSLWCPPEWKFKWSHNVCNGNFRSVTWRSFHNHSYIFLLPHFLFLPYTYFFLSR